MVLGPRFLIQAGFIIAVAVVAGIERLGTWWIIALVAAAWALVALVELGLWMRHGAARRQRTAPESQSEPEPMSRPKPPHVVVRPEARPVPEPPGRPPLIAAPPPPPEPVLQPEPEPQSEPEPEPTVAYLPPSDVPRAWNLWELERVTRDNATDDVARNEERDYLLMYLREFAGPDGNLPADFDGLVRDAFGDLLHAVAT